MVGRMKIRTLGFMMLLVVFTGLAQNEKKMKENNPLICDPVKGFCEMPGDSAQLLTEGLKSGTKPVKIVYFTDPICSSCWGIEPQLRKLKLEYGNSLQIEYKMGGLLKDWSYNSGGISKPSDVAHHWDEVSAYYQMPIDGDVWLEDPLDSSYPPSIAFKAAQIQDEYKAVAFLRVLREMVFLKKMNITKWENMELAAKQVGLDVVLLKSDFEGMAKQLFEADLELGKQMGVRGFPTLFISDSSGTTTTIYGVNAYAAFEKAIADLSPGVVKMTYSTDWKSLFAFYPTLTLREFAELSNRPVADCENELNTLVEQGELLKLTTKNGSIWIREEK